jgi:hypothetical protein
MLPSWRNLALISSCDARGTDGERVDEDGEWAASQGLACFLAGGDLGGLEAEAEEGPLSLRRTELPDATWEGERGTIGGGSSTTYTKHAARARLAAPADEMSRAPPSLAAKGKPTSVGLRRSSLPPLPSGPFDSLASSEHEEEEEEEEEEERRTSLPQSKRRWVLVTAALNCHPAHTVLTAPAPASALPDPDPSPGPGDEE